MLRSIKQLYRDKLGASDGDIGHVEDFYFNDQSWVVRYVVANTGTWLSGRQVLLSPHAFVSLGQPGKILRVTLDRKQIEHSPSIATRLPVSRQFEEEYHAYYGWPYYWQGDALWGMSGVPVMEVPASPFPSKVTASGSKTEGADPHLRSTQAVNGYHIQATNGKMGHVCDFMIDDKTWAISGLVVKIGHRFSGKEVQVPTSKVSRVSYEESTIFVNLTSEAIEQSPEPQAVTVETSA